ncbi:MAG: hypothetical protein PHF95_05875 [bacterium]|nr:hypothetical protein [bacterium]
MSEEENIKQLVGILRKVPAKNLELIRIANKIPIIDGLPDEKVLAELQPDIKRAIEEANMYGASTMQALEHLSYIRGMA